MAPGSSLAGVFNVGGGELLVIFLVALIVLGPDKLPDAARKLGNIVHELRRMSNGFQREMRTAFDEAARPQAPRPTLEAVEDPPAEQGPQTKPADPAA